MIAVKALRKTTLLMQEEPLLLFELIVNANGYHQAECAMNLLHYKHLLEYKGTPWLMKIIYFYLKFL